MGQPEFRPRRAEQSARDDAAIQVCTILAQIILERMRLARGVCGHGVVRLAVPEV